MEEQGEPAAGPVGSFESVHVHTNVDDSPTHEASHENNPPPVINPMMQQFVEAMQRMAQAQSSRSQETNIDKNYERVRKQGAKEFVGTTDPAVAEEWLRNTERILDRIECTPEQRLKYAVSLLEKDALDWWETVSRSRSRPLTLTWNDFLREFADKYTPPVYKNKKKIEFLKLKQNEKSVADYELQFVRLSKYAPEEIATDEMKRDRFERGLKLEIREKIAVKPPTYNALLEAALRAEETLVERSTIETKKKKLTGSFSASSQQRGSSSFRGSGFQRGSFRGGFSGRGDSFLARSGTVSSGRGGYGPRKGFGSNPILCYYCNRPGHIAKDCLKRKSDMVESPTTPAQSSVGENVQQFSGGRGRGRGGRGSGATVTPSAGPSGQTPPQARVYAVTRQEAPSAPEIITGIFSVCGFDAHVLIDPRSTCSFISYDFALHVYGKKESLGYDIYVSMPAGGITTANTVIRNCPVVLHFMVSEQGLGQLG